MFLFFRVLGWIFHGSDYYLKALVWKFYEQNHYWQTLFFIAENISKLLLLPDFADTPSPVSPAVSEELYYLQHFGSISPFNSSIYFLEHNFSYNLSSIKHPSWRPSLPAFWPQIGLNEPPCLQGSSSNDFLSRAQGPMMLIVGSNEYM